MKRAAIIAALLLGCRSVVDLTPHDDPDAGPPLDAAIDAGPDDDGAVDASIGFPDAAATDDAAADDAAFPDAAPSLPPDARF